MPGSLFDDGSLDEYTAAQENPAAPAGMGQGAAAAIGVATGDPAYATSSLGGSLLERGFEGMTPTWYTGRNLEDVENGWDSDFVESFMKGQEQAQTEGTLSTYFSRPDATGVVTWDHTTADGRHQLTFGDVFQDGKKVANVYDQFDRDTANLMMADWVLSAQEKADVYSSADRTPDADAEVKMPGLDEAITAVRERNAVEIPQALAAQEFNEGVQERAEGFREGAVDELITAGGAAGGLALAGGAVAATGVGAPVGAGLIAAGAGLGALGAYLNKDALTEQAARAYEITSLSMREHNDLAGFGTGVSQWAGFGAKLISPLSNLTQGAYDWKEGDVGDGSAEFYATDEGGERKAADWVKVVDVAATVGDSFAQFASPVGLALYTTQMTGTIGGGVAELAFSGGESFDYRRAGFDNIFTDDEGNFDPVSGAAGIGKIGIDVVQLGMARGLAGKANAERIGMGDDAAYWGMFGGRQGERVGGHVYLRNEAGEIVGRKRTLSLLAPSEQLASVSANAAARRAALTAKGGPRAVTADDYYRASLALAHGEKKVRTVLTNAMGEGYEEGFQAVLEPMSHNQDVSWREVGTAAAYGFAAGTGMGLGISRRGVSADDRMWAQARLVRETMTAGAETITKAEWASMTDLQKRTAAALDDMMRETAFAALRKIEEDQALETVGGAPAAHKIWDSVQSWWNTGQDNVMKRVDGAFVITQIEDAGEVNPDGSLRPGSLPSDAVGQSGIQLLQTLLNHQKGINEQRAQLAADLESFDSRIDGALAEDEVNAARAKLERDLATTESVLTWSQRINTELDALVKDMYDPASATVASIEADAEVINVLLRDIFHRRLDTFDGVVLSEEDKLHLAMAVSTIFARDPHDSAGSYQPLVPQVSARLTAANAQNVLEISHAILPAIRGDFDGDKLRPLNTLVLDQEEFMAARSGAYFLGTGASVNIKAPKYEKYQVEYLAKALSSNSPTLQAFATGTKTQIGDAIRNRYAGVVSSNTLDRVLTAFFERLDAGDPDSRNTLIDGLAMQAGAQITEYARTNLSNEWLWIDQLVKSNLNWFQSVHAEFSTNRAVEVNTETGRAVKQATNVDERRAEQAAAAGITLGLWTDGESMFRKFQKLHYTAVNSPVLSAEGLEPMSLTDMILLYEGLNNQVTEAEVDAIRAKDRITARVYLQLDKLARDAEKAAAETGERLTRSQALAVVANMAVRDYDIDKKTGEPVESRSTISLTQMLLKRELARDRQEKDAIWSISPELQAKHKKLENMTRPNSPRGESKGAEKAFVEVVGAQQFYTLLGEESEVFGPHLTVEQFVRKYAAMSDTQREQESHRLRLQPEYLGRRDTKNQPYNFSEVANDEITAYRSILDAILAVGNNLHAERQDRSERVSENWREAHRLLRASLQEMIGGRRDGEIDTDVVRRLLEGNADVARRFFAQIPNSIAHLVVEYRGDQAYVANWFYETLTIKNSKQAEMHYWRNLLLAEIHGLDVESQIREEGSEKENEISYSKLKRRMHRLWVDLSRLPDGGITLSRFVERMEQSTDLDEFIAWVNETPGIKRSAAPFTAWVDDTAEFDPDKAQGGWTTALQGAELREAIGMLRKSAQSLHKDMLDEKATWTSDQHVLAAVKRVERGDPDATPKDREVHARFSKALEMATKRQIGLGPAAMIYQSIGAVLGMYSQAHTKGKNPANVELLGMFDALRDAYGYVTNFERLMASLTSVNLSAISQTPHELAKGALRSMDEHGREVEWNGPSVMEMVGLFENPDTRHLARSIVFPQVMERTLDGRMSTQMVLSSKSLKALTSDSNLYNESMFPVNDSLSNDHALRYASMVEATARQYGGHFSLQRVVNDLVIARTSASRRVLSIYDIEQMVTQGYRDVVQVLQMSGELAARTMESDDDLLAPALALAKESQRVARGASILGMTSAEERESFDAFLDSQIKDLEAEAQEDAQEYIKSDPEKALRIFEARDRAIQKIEFLRGNDVVAAARAMFSWPADADPSAQQKQAVADYVLSKLSMLGQTQAVKIEMNKLTQHVLDSANHTLPDFVDWRLLSRAAIASYIEDMVGVPAGVTIPLFPDNEDSRYYDPSYSYLVEPLLDRKHPLVQAAKDLHLQSGRELITTDEQMLSLLERTVLDNKKLGPWTGDIPRASIEANQRIDSAAAAPALSIFGNEPKTQGVISAATKREYRVPTPDMLSTVVLSMDDLRAENPLEHQVVSLLPGNVRRSGPLALLNNRFAASVIAQTPNGPVDLLALDENLGRPFTSEPAAAASGYVEISVDRIYAALDMLDTTASAVEVKFFHPDSMPAVNVKDNTWRNNLFFEGTSFKLDADRHLSLNSTLWFAFGSIGPDGQAQALDASKLGLPAMKVIPTFGADERTEIEAGWATDLGDVLRQKTAAVMNTDLGFGKLDVEFFNAVYKNFKIRHYARLADGTIWSADEVIAYQAANPGLAHADSALNGAKLWVPSDDVLRDMLGDQMFQGVGRLLDLDLEFDLAKTPAYVGVRPEMLESFAGMQSGAVVGIGNTTAANRARQSTLTVRTQMPRAEREVFERQRLYFDQLKTDIAEARSTLQSTFDPITNLRNAVIAGQDMLSLENLAMNWVAGGAPYIGPRSPSDPYLSTTILREAARATEADAYSTGWIYRHRGSANPANGLLTQVSLTGSTEKAFQVAPGDIVVLEVDSFDTEDEALKVADYMMGRGAIIALGSTDGSTDTTATLTRHLSASNYENVVGTRRVYMPRPLGSMYQTPRARYSSLLEIEAIGPRDMLTIFNVQDRPIEENASWVVSEDNLLDVRVSVDLLPTAFHSQFGVPVGAMSNIRQIAEVRTLLRSLNTVEGRKALKDQAHSDLKRKDRQEADRDFDVAFDEMMARFDRSGESVLPAPGDDFGQGSMIPLVDMRGNVLLYRHGYQPPDLDKLTELMAAPVEGHGPIRVASYTANVEPGATIRSGRVAQISPRAGYGLQAELHTTLQIFGDKVQLELNGMKYLLTPKPDSVVMPGNTLLATRGIDLIASTNDMVSKEAFKGVIDNHRNAFAYFGIDFTEDLTRFFFPAEDAKSPAVQQKTLNLLRAVEQHGERIPIEAAHEVLSGHLIGTSVTSILPSLRDINPDLSPNWLDELNAGSVESQIAAATIVYLMTPGARIDHVLKSGGFNDPTNTDGAKKSRLMPRLFTQYFDNATFESELRTEINRRFNVQINNTAADGTGYVLRKDFMLEIRNADPSKNMRGWLQFAEAHSTGDNPITNGQAFENSTSQDISQHSAAVAYQAIGALTPQGERGRKQLREVMLQRKGFGITRFRSEGAEQPGAEAWAMITNRMRRVAGGRSMWNTDTPAEEERRAFASDEVGHYRRAILTSDNDTWSDRQRTQYDDYAVAIVESLGLLAEQKGLVDYWVRQWLGRADGVDVDGNALGWITGRDAVEAAHDILEMVNDGYLPTTSAMVPLMHVNDLQLIFRANRNSSRPWSPKVSMKDGNNERAAMNWDDWVHIALGSAILSDEVFDPFFLLATDGMMHSYQNAIESLTDLPVSLDALVARAALDPEVNETVMALSKRDKDGVRLRVSLEPNTDLLASETIVLDAMHASVEDVIGGKRVGGRTVQQPPPAGAVARRRSLLRKHRKENGIPMPVDRGMKDFRKNGLEFNDRSTNANAFIRSLILLRIGTATLNPALWLSMGPEQWIRGTLDRAANILTGESTAGATAERLAQAGWSFYTPEQIRKLDVLYDQLGSRNDFKSMIYRDLAFLRPHGDSIGRLEKLFEKYATAGTRMQDATYGLRSKTLARRYVEAALQHIQATPTQNVVTVDRLISELTVNPEFLQRNHPDAHRAASNAVAQIRSLKQTTASVLLRGIIEPAADSENLAVNLTGNLLGKIPLIFSNYLLNVVTTITGLQGADQFLATWMDARKKGRFGAAQTAVRGKEIESDLYTDMGAVVESVDLTRAFIRGGITHTALFTLAMAAGGLGLSGEDEETKKRRRLAKAQGAGFVYDPRSVVNDFRNADAIYFDWLPTLGPVDLNWTLRQFISPIIGIERAIETGDTRHITWGFEDAIGSFPLINTMMWRDVVETGEQLKAQANEESLRGNDAAAMGLMTNFVGIYERMLFENAFINQVYVAADRWDRDPYALPLRDSDKDLQGDIEGNTRPNDLALQDYIDPETGERKVGYMTRDARSAQTHAFTETRATMATVLALFTGGFESDFIRYNMPIKEREIEFAPTETDSAEALIIASILAKGGGPLKQQVSVTPKEVEDAVRQQLYEQKGYYAPDSEVMPIARRISRQSGVGALSVINAEGFEDLTDEGIRMLVRDLGLGRIKLGDPALQGVHVTYEQRVEIQKEWQHALVQEGVDLGLDKSKAEERMQRLWQGPYDDPSVLGIGDILWMKPEQGGLSYADSATYKQLNTTYVVGPFGQPYSTGFSRSKGVFGAILNAVGLVPLHTQVGAGSDAMGQDSRFNSTDMVNRINTGLRGLVLKNDTENVPTDKEIADAIIEGFKEASKGNYTPFTPFASTSGGGGGGWGGWSSFGGYGGGGGGSYAPRVYFQELRDMPDVRTPYGNTIRSVNADNPLIRRADIRRERVWSERGRLKQWQ